MGFALEGDTEEARGDDPPMDTADLETPLEDLFSPSESGEDAGQPVSKVATAEKKTKSLDNGETQYAPGPCNRANEAGGGACRAPFRVATRTRDRQSRDDRVHAGAAGLPKPRTDDDDTCARALSAVYYNVPLPPMGTRTLRSDGSDGAMASVSLAL
ncbi:hypothetical protein HPB52_013554 [Rhipicephalus sanguineus]|uniref:Uncharacterized protein n=1 Tax=Rhipicephalus sanguineus TaxID=34632 RepID=A0A9D4SWX7_RHISA|nr:hypothetical protein HPB52_013554 [Rhipicephalus sanguineus]